ncbi:MAG: sensor histidine kinase [Roseburia sp.]
MLGIHQATTIVFAILFFIFCKIKFHESVLQTGINIVCIYVIVAICQFIAVLVICIFIPENEALRALCVNGAVLLFNFFVLPKLGLNTFRNSIKFKNVYTIIVLCIVGGFALSLFIQVRAFRGIRADMLVAVIPVMLMLLTVLAKWNDSKKTIERMEAEKESNIQMQQQYDELLEEVRIRQHEFKNQMAAVFSSHYTYKTYEQLVDAQKEYCEILTHENRYNNLLLIGNNILAGFLYEKFKQVEDNQICLDYKINAKFENIYMPMHHLIEVFGILIDNAVEATKDRKDKEIYIEAGEDEMACYFTIRNLYPHVSYSEIEQWFQLDYSSKGSERGIGLFHVKSLCEEWNGNVVCENVRIEDKNWIQFMVLLNK